MHGATRRRRHSALRPRWLGAILAVLVRTAERPPAPLRFAAALAWAAAIWWLSSRAGGTRPAPVGLSWAFNLGHAVLFGMLAALLDLGWRGARPWLAIALAIGYGFVDEWHQSLVPRRSPDPFDVVTDAGGALLAVALLARLRGGPARWVWRAGAGLALAIAGSAAATFA